MARAEVTAPDDAALAAFERAWAELRQARRKQTLLFGLIFVACLAVSVYVGEVRVGTFVEGLPGFFNYIHDILPVLRAESLLADVAEWYWAIGNWLSLLLDTVLIAYLGTLAGGLVAFALCFSASRNLAPNGAVYFVTRRLLELARGVPELVYAMILVFAYGIGPLAGVMAIAIHSAGALGKLFAEVNENADMGPVDGVRAAGGDWFQGIRYAIVPQVLPNFLSYALLRFEINVRSAAVIGFVGAGGIGQELMFVIRQFVYTDISAIVLLIIITVSIIDVSCEQLRTRFIEGTPVR